MAGKTATTEEMLARARALTRSGRMAEALAQYRAVLARFPESRRARDGLAEVVKAAAHRPDPILWAQARGLVAQGRAAEAIGPLERLALQVPLSPEVQMALASCLAATGRSAAALERYRTVTLLLPGHPDARFGEATMLSQLGRPAEAEAAYRAILAEMPDHRGALNNLGLGLQAQGRHREAADCFAGLLALDPEDPVARFNLANCLRDLGRIDEAEAAYRRVMAADPTQARAANNLGVLFEETGRRAEAENMYREACRRDPGYAGAWRHFANVHRFRPGDSEIAEIESHAAGAKRPEDRAELLFGLGQARDATGDTAAAFAAFAEANALRKAELDYDIALDRKLFATIRRAFDPPPAPLQAGPAMPRPVFVTGMMRSGTSLVEQILSSHSQVQAAGELDALTHQALPLMERLAADSASRIDGVDLVALRQGYLAELAELGLAAPVVTDKMPVNFRWIGFILTAFPEARVVHLTRDPMAVGWSIFRTYFWARGNGYAYDLGDIGAYSRMHDGLMAHWHRVFPDRILEIDYEILTEDQEGQTRRLLDHCGLPWEEACLRFHEAPGRVRTASAGQVRQPMYRGSSEAWRRYEPFLGPLKAALAADGRG